MMIFSFDAETDSLYGRVWAIGAVVLDGLAVVDTFKGQVDPSVVGDPWVQKNIVPVVNLPRFESIDALLEAFWGFWIKHREAALCVADFGAPVEAYLFRSCVERDLAGRMWGGPYPMHELGTLLLAAGIDPDVDRRQMSGIHGLVQHNPVDDALAAGWCWQIAMEHINSQGEAARKWLALEQAASKGEASTEEERPRRVLGVAP